MRIRFLVDCGSAYGVVMAAGSIAEVPDEVAAWYLGRGRAEDAEKPPKPAPEAPAALETAAVAAPENAAKRTTKPRTRKGA